MAGNSVGFAGAEALSSALKKNSTLTTLGIKKFGDLNQPRRVSTLFHRGLDGGDGIERAPRQGRGEEQGHVDGDGDGDGDGARSEARGALATGLDLLVDALMINTALSNIDLSRNGIGQTGGFGIARLLSSGSSPLASLSLAYNNLGSAGCIAIFNSLHKNEKLRRLDLTACGAGPTTKTEHGLKVVDSLAHCLSTNIALSRLDLVRDAVTPHVAELICGNVKPRVCGLDLNFGPQVVPNNMLNLDSHTSVPYTPSPWLG
jgi:hypothetical protein